MLAIRAGVQVVMLLVRTVSKTAPHVLREVFDILAGVVQELPPLALAHAPRDASGHALSSSIDAACAFLEAAAGGAETPSFDDRLSAVGLLLGLALAKGSVAYAVKSAALLAQFARESQGGIEEWTSSISALPMSQTLESLAHFEIRPPALPLSLADNHGGWIPRAEPGNRCLFDGPEFYGFSSVRLEARVPLSRGGNIFYEATLETASCMQIGWATGGFLPDTAEVGVGDDLHGFAADGSRSLRWHHGSSPYGGGWRWRRGDVVGCLVDIDRQEMRFLHNGVDLGVAFSASSPGGGARGMEWPEGDDAVLMPAASFMHTQGCSFNFGETPFQCPPAVPHTAVLHAAAPAGPTPCTPIEIPPGLPESAGEASAFIVAHLDRLAHAPAPPVGTGQGAGQTDAAGTSVPVPLRLEATPATFEALLSMLQSALGRRSGAGGEEGRVTPGGPEQDHGVLSSLRLLQIQLRHVAGRQGSVPEAVKEAGLASPSEDGPPPLSAGEAQGRTGSQSTGRRLLHAIFELLVDPEVPAAEGATEEPSPVALEASASLVAGFDIFYPSPIEQASFLVALLQRRSIGQKRAGTSTPPAAAFVAGAPEGERPLRPIERELMAMLLSRFENGRAIIAELVTAPREQLEPLLATLVGLTVDDAMAQLREASTGRESGVDSTGPGWELSPSLQLLKLVQLHLASRVLRLDETAAPVTAYSEALLAQAARVIDEVVDMASSGASGGGEEDVRTALCLSTHTFAGLLVPVLVTMLCQVPLSAGSAASLSLPVSRLLQSLQSLHGSRIAMNQAEQSYGTLHAPFEACRDATGKADPTALVTGLMTEGPARALLEVGAMTCLSADAARLN